MIILVMTACLLSAPSNCHEVNMAFSDADVTMMACTASAMPYVAQYIEDHPAESVKRWACRFPFKDTPA